MVQHGAALEIRVSPWKKCLVPHLIPRKYEEKPSKSRGAQIDVIYLFLKKKKTSRDRILEAKNQGNLYKRFSSWHERLHAISLRPYHVCSSQSCGF